ncbi:MAG: hypothetical protein P8N49_02945 [Opitutales bacterium]|nr:hypothetical protein [Opitutales bacterium]
MKDISKNQPPVATNNPVPPTPGFAKVVAGGRVVRPDGELPFLERMVTGTLPAKEKANARESAILASVASNIEAGINIVDAQEVGLAKIGGKLADISLALNRCKIGKISTKDGESAQVDMDAAKQAIHKVAQSVHANTSLFSQGPSKPITVAIPNRGEWEGISIDRPNLDTPGIKTLLSGKVYGDSDGYFIDSGSIKRAFTEWRNHCISNRLLWGNLMDRLHGVYRKLNDVKEGASWSLPLSPENPKIGPLRRPNRNN